jgi:hypothetical protein
MKKTSAFWTRLSVQCDQTEDFLNNLCVYTDTVAEPVALHNSAILRQPMRPDLTAYQFPQALHFFWQPAFDERDQFPGQRNGPASSRRNIFLSVCLQRGHFDRC